MKGIFEEIKKSRNIFYANRWFLPFEIPNKWKHFSKIPVQRIAEVVRARFYHGAKFRRLLIFALVVILLGSAFPKPCWTATAANFLLAPFGNSAICGVVGSKRKFEKVLRPTLQNCFPRWVRWKAMQPNFYAISQKSIHGNLLFCRSRKKQGAKTAEKRC